MIERGGAMTHRIEIEPRYSETDQMGIIYHANYFSWFDIARTRYVEQVGFKVHELEELGMLFVVLKAEIQYKKPAVFGRDVVIDTTCIKYTGVRTGYEFLVKDKETEELLVRGYVELGSTNKDLRVIPVSRIAPELDEAYKGLVRKK